MLDQIKKFLQVPILLNFFMMLKISYKIQIGYLVRLEVRLRGQIEGQWLVRSLVLRLQFFWYNVSLICSSILLGPALWALASFMLSRTSRLVRNKLKVSVIVAIGMRQELFLAVGQQCTIRQCSDCVGRLPERYAHTKYGSSHQRVQQ